MQHNRLQSISTIHKPHHRYIMYMYSTKEIKYTIRSIVCEASCHSVTRSLGYSVTRSLSISLFSTLRLTD